MTCIKMKQKFLIVDTNNLIYLKNDIPQLSQKAIKKFLLLIEEGSLPCVTEQTIREFLVVQTNLLNKKKIATFDINTEVEWLFNHFQIFYPSLNSIILLKQYVSKYNLVGKKIHDANVVAVCAVNDINSLFTH